MRTDCNSSSIHFTPLSRQQVVADFEVGPITSDAGAILLREVDRRLILFDRIDAVIPDPRNPELITHTQRTLIAQRIIACGVGGSQRSRSAADRSTHADRHREWGG